MIEDPPLLTVRRNFPRPSAELVEKLKGTATGVVVDCMDGRGALHHSVKPVTPGATSFTGVAVTCHTGPADNLAVFAAMDICQPGDVVLIATDEFLTTAVIGDLVVGMAANIGAVAMVTDGAVRDVAGICETGIACFGAVVTPNSPARNGPGTAGLPIVCAGQPVSSGDVVVADADGVVIVPQDQIEAVLARLPDVLAAEAGLEEKVKAGLQMPDFAKDILSSDRVLSVD
ncbi:MAG: RraA family protein [Alphaproteobacteria bacterium]|nr:RraA family protein [Alphaproteobacteria bacterium]